MSASSRVARGRRTNVVVAAWLRTHGHPAALPTYGSEPGQDVKNIEDWSVEVKARTGFEPRAWLRQAQKAAAAGQRACVIIRPNGVGENAADYLVLRRLEDDELNRCRDERRH